MTHYNNKTYRIDDIDFNKNPQSKFLLKKENREISFKEYYQTHYKVIIKSETQPLLISHPPRRERDTPEQIVYLIPELCDMTGLTTDMKLVSIHSLVSLLLIN